jgi:hypothetical protein
MDFVQHSLGSYHHGTAEGSHWLRGVQVDLEYGWLVLETVYQDLGHFY